jgi:branched-chain amino acid transport system substrate-binding protein
VAPVTGQGNNIQKPGECGEGTGKKATGEPIKLGGMATNIPGVDFTWITKMTGAYFECVNDNGGIKGRPIDYIAEEEQVDPQQVASLATKLVEKDKVLASSEHEPHRVQRQRRLLRQAGLPRDRRRRRQDCFTSPNFSAVNMGPYYSSLGGAQAALRAGAREGWSSSPPTSRAST